MLVEWCSIKSVHFGFFVYLGLNPVAAVAVAAHVILNVRQKELSVLLLTSDPSCFLFVYKIRRAAGLSERGPQVNDQKYLLLDANLSNKDKTRTTYL